MNTAEIQQSHCEYFMMSQSCKYAELLHGNLTAVVHVTAAVQCLQHCGPTCTWIVCKFVCGLL